MGRRNKWESLIKLDVQDIPNEENHFSSYELEWTPIGVDNNQQIDLCAAIPLHRLPHFVKGEGLLDGTETTFIRKRHNEHILIEPSNHTTKIYSRFVSRFNKLVMSSFFNNVN